MGGSNFLNIAGIDAQSFCAPEEAVPRSCSSGTWWPTVPQPRLCGVAAASISSGCMRNSIKNSIRLVGIGEVTLEELEAMMSAWINAGAPRPVLEGTREQKALILRTIAQRGDSQMRAVVESYLGEL
jgi:hypothetical protein